MDLERMKAMVTIVGRGDGRARHNLHASRPVTTTRLIQTDF